jgi:hypothetical protein
MALKIYSVCLEESVVKRALKISSKYGSKLSPLINQIFIEWIEREEKRWAQIS